VKYVQDLMEATKGFKDLYNLGKALGFDVREIEITIAQSNMSYHLAKAELFYLWKNKNPENSLKDLAMLIEGIGYTDVAEDIKQKLNGKPETKLLSL